MPVSKNGGRPGIENHPDDLLCYQTSRTEFGTRTAYLNNQFGQQTVELIARREFCVGSITNPPTTSTTAAPATTTTTTLP